MKKLTYEFVKKQFEKEGYKLLTKKYVNNKQKLKYVCPKGHKHSIKWFAWYNGVRCPYCSRKIQKTIEFIRSEFEKEGYKLLTKIYKNCKQKLEYVCPKGHKHSISWSSWQKGCRCYYCGICKGANKRKYTMDFIKDAFKKEGYILLTEEYVNCNQKLYYVCPNGHEHSIDWSSWNNAGQRCPFCYGKIKKKVEFIMSEFEKEGYILLTKEYINSKQKLSYVCSEGHQHAVTWGNWSRGYRCPTCANIKMSGTGHPNWKGGISCEPYCDVWLDKDFKESIKERDNYQCQNPDCWETSKRLTIHHIDYVKKDCNPNNLITLCASCNSRANKDRRQHTEFYSNIMRKRGLKNAI